MADDDSKFGPRASLLNEYIQEQMPQAKNNLTKKWSETNQNIGVDGVDTSDIGIEFSSGTHGNPRKLGFITEKKNFFGKNRDFNPRRGRSNPWFLAHKMAILAIFDKFLRIET